MLFEVGSTKIALHDSVASQVQHAQHAVTYVNQQFTSIGMKGERVDHITLSSESQVSGHIRKENFPQFFFSTFDVDKLGKIRRYHWKQSLKISEIAKFESDLLKTNDEIAPQKREILTLFYGSGGGGGAPHHSNVCKCSQLSGAIFSLA